VRLHLDERLILRDARTLGDEPPRDLGLGQPLAPDGASKTWKDVSSSVRNVDRT
jgi:hypothetical protein